MMILAALPYAVALAYVGIAVFGGRLRPWQSRVAVASVWLLHSLLWLNSLLTEPARFGFAPALSVTVWLVLTVYAIETQHFPLIRSRWALAGMGALAVMAAQVFPGSPLNMGASAWLPLHLAFGIGCYGLFAAAVLHAWLMGRAEAQMRRAQDANAGVPLLTLERLTFRFAWGGFILLSATLAAGWWFGEHLYGRAWRWDHKTVFSVLSWLTIAVLLLGRQGLGWRGRTASRMLYVGSTFLLLAYVGSRFVLEVILKRSI